jgi:hypothetical protein
MTEYGIVIFHTTSAVMQAEKELLKAGLKIKLIPVPREFSSDCGISVRFDWQLCDEVRSLLVEGNIETEGIYCLKVRGSLESN